MLNWTGGGHNPSGASSTNGGLVIDLSKYLDQVKVDVEARIAHVGGGALWSDVDAATCPFGLATVGGTVSEVSDTIPLSYHVDM
jgi:FAD/FMN-containing dehydrogenase